MREKLNPRLLDVLICPFEQVAYPIENGVPVLLAEKAETLKE